MKYYHYKTATVPNPTREGNHPTRNCSYQEAFEEILNEWGDKGYELNDLIEFDQNPEWMIAVFRSTNPHAGGTKILGD